RGVEAVDALCAGVAEQTGIDADRIFTSSTGVIGEPLPYDRITAKIGELSANLNAGGIEGAAKAIMTTDTFPKGSAAEITVNGQTVKIAGIAKGSGMIAPDMATMLVYIFTDAKIGYDALQGVLSKLTDKTFNCITVDSDTSTSDTLLIGATGASGVDVSDNADFEAALHKVMLDLSHQVIRDGEGATKFVEIQVTGAASDADAKRVGLSVANSPLVKTAIAGEDANWGRIVAAVGKSGAEADRDRLSIRFGDITVAENGWRAPNYSEADASAYMKNAELIIGVDLGIGTGASTVWTCDLTYEYIRINADYRS
ncbi:MAG: bifunctional glutamate N-acetyltransferase/amino-acid acetyltransferase ArgJ, partial [Marivivens sp.]|nr:bifunctional glutamate N-acetyltransferase/amino-acid acetyltransferase ArgJ [Marivivens sp.]